MKNRLIPQLKSQDVYEFANTPSNQKMGAGAIVVRDGKVLMGKRKGGLCPGTWSIPGGALEYGSRLGGKSTWEKPELAAVRELYEETGLVGNSARVVAVCEHYFHERDVTWKSIFVRINIVPAEPHLREPNKCEYWSWFDPKDLPSPLFPPAHWLFLESGYMPE